MSLPPEVQAAFDAQLTELSRIVDVPVPPLAWGVDLSCITDCTDTFAETPINSPRLIAEEAARMLITPRGSLIDDTNRGFDLRGYCNRGVTLADLRMLQARTRSEIAKDVRVAAADVSVIVEGTGLKVTAQITPADPNVVEFSFVLSVTSSDVLITLIGA